MERREFLKLTLGFTAAASAIAATAMAAQAAPMLPSGDGKAPTAPQMSTHTHAEAERKGADEAADQDLSSRRHWRRHWRRRHWRRHHRHHRHW